MKKRRYWWLWAVGMLLLIGGSTWAVLRARGYGNTKIDEALVVSVQHGDLSIEVIETGKVEPREKVEVKSKVAGQVERVFVDEGDKVRKGQMLLRLDPTDYKRDVARAEAEVEQAKNNLEYAQLTLKRREDAVKTGGVSQADVDLSANEVKVRGTALKLANVALAAAQDRLRYTEIVSPIDGTVIARGIQAGEVISPGVQATFEGKPLLTIADLSTLVVKADLNQIDVAKVRLGQRVELFLDALPGKTYDAMITKITPAAVLPKGKDQEVFPVEATLSKPDRDIKPGMTADTRIYVETHENVLSLPIEAVEKETDKSFVTKLVTDPQGKQRKERVEVKTGSKNDRVFEITQGLAKGDRVVLGAPSKETSSDKM